MDKQVISVRNPRRKHDEALKRELVERSLQSGASVAAIAQANGINANLLFNWRRLHLRRDGSQTPMSTPVPILLPVTLEEVASPGTRTAMPSKRTPSGVIEIDIGAARIRVRGVVDAATVRCVLLTLRAA